MPREAKGADSPEVWLEYARADLVFAGIPLPEGGRYDQLCFSAQQAAGKSIKAVLLHLGVDFPYTHSLQALLDLVPESVGLPPRIEAVAGLTDYAVLGRYPGLAEPASEADYREALSIAEAVYAWAEALVKGMRSL